MISKEAIIQKRERDPTCLPMNRDPKPICKAETATALNRIGFLFTSGQNLKPERLPY
jgi:hypothetical protein